MGALVSMRKGGVYIIYSPQPQGWKLALGAIEGKDRQALPRIGLASGPDLVGQFHRLLMDPFKSGPGDVCPYFAHSTAMHGLSVGPKPTVLSLPEQGQTFPSTLRPFPPAVSESSNTTKRVGNGNFL